MYAKLVNNIVVEWPIPDIRARLPNVSLPTNTQNNSALPSGFVYVGSLPMPQFDGGTQKAQPSTPVLINNVWTHGWHVVELSAEEIASVARPILSLSPEP